MSSLLLKSSGNLSVKSLIIIHSGDSFNETLNYVFKPCFWCIAGDNIFISETSLFDSLQGITAAIYFRQSDAIHSYGKPSSKPMK